VPTRVAASAARLCVGIDDPELDAREAGVHHAVDGVAAAAAHADDLAARRVQI
jgi:hypothetical protein